MVIELINTGSELMLGTVLNTHHQWIARELAGLGLTLARQRSVPDSASEVRDAVADALTRADLVITTGGLGPTSDDLTRACIAELVGRKLHEDPEVAAKIEGFFSARGRKMPPRTRVQALVPEGALVLPNANGTAPGLALELDPNPFRPAKSWLLMLPGPPRELRPMFTSHVLPLISQKFQSEGPFVCRILRSTGLGESLVEARLEADLLPLCQEGLDVGYCARPGEVDVRLCARGHSAASLVGRAESIVRRKLSRFIYGTGDDDIASVVVRLLSEQGATVAVAESCTGGLLGHRITNVPGASAVFAGGVIAYSNEVKQRLLRVPGDLLAEHGAVSEPVARAMASGALSVFETGFAVAITGIAGPGGGSESKPVGTVFIAVASRSSVQVVRAANPYDRETFKHVTAQQALARLRQFMLADPSEMNACD